MSKLTIKNRYGVVPNKILNDDKLSLKAKGLFAYLQSKPDGWKFSVERIAQQMKDGRDSVQSAVQELEKAGYLRRKRIKNEEGKWAGYDYILAEKPLTEKPSTDKGGDISNKDIVKKKKILSKDNTKKYGNPDINELIEFFKRKFGLDILDGTQKENRRYCNLAIKKFGKDKVKEIIKIASKDRFWHNKMTEFKTLYYNGVKILNGAKKEEDEAMRAYLERVGFKTSQFAKKIADKMQMLSPTERTKAQEEASKQLRKK